MKTIAKIFYTERRISLWRLNKVFVWDWTLWTCVSIMDIAVCRGSRTIRSIRKGARQFCSSLMNYFSAWSVFSTLGSLALFKYCIVMKLPTWLLRTTACFTCTWDRLKALVVGLLEVVWALLEGLVRALGRLLGGMRTYLNAAQDSVEVSWRRSSCRQCFTKFFNGLSRCRGPHFGVQNHAKIGSAWLHSIQALFECFLIRYLIVFEIKSSQRDPN